MEEYNKILEKIKKSIKKMNLKTLLKTKKLIENEIKKSNNNDEITEALNITLNIIEEELNKKFH